MKNIWITTAEIQVQPSDMLSADTVGFMRISMWASSQEEFVQKLEAYLSKYKWKLPSMENTAEVDPFKDYGDEVNQMIDETLQDRKCGSTRDVLQLQTTVRVWSSPC